MFVYARIQEFLREWNSEYLNWHHNAGKLLKLMRSSHTTGNSSIERAAIPCIHSDAWTVFRSAISLLKDRRPSWLKLPPISRPIRHTSLISCRVSAPGKSLLLANTSSVAEASRSSRSSACSSWAHAASRRASALSTTHATPSVLSK